MARTRENLDDVEAQKNDAHDAVEAAKQEAKALVEAAKAEENLAKEAAREAVAAAKEEEKALKAIDQGKPVRIRNRSVRGETLLTTEGQSVFLGPKETVELDGNLVSGSIRRQADQGLIVLEG